MRIKPLHLEHAPLVHQLQEESLGYLGWSPQGTKDLLGLASVDAWGCFEGATLKGFLMVQSAVDEAEVLSITVKETCRGQGLGTALMEHMESIMKQKFIKQIFIEVKSTNKGVQLFYQRLGFAAYGQRPNYYPSKSGARASAITMRKKI